MNLTLFEKKWWLYFCFFISLRPSYLVNFSFLENILNIGLIIASIIIVLSIFVQKTKVNSFSFIVLAYLLLKFLSTFINDNFNFSVLATPFRDFILVAFIILIINKSAENYERILRCLTNVCVLLSSINIITMLTFQSGIIQRYTHRDTIREMWFLGSKNPSIRFLFFTLVLILLSSIIFKKKLSLSNYLLIFCSFISSIIVSSATGILVIATLILFFVFIDKIKINIIFNTTFFFIAGFLVTILIYQFKLTYYFEFLIVNLLQRNLTMTGRLVIWERSISNISENFFLGTGLMSSWDNFLILRASHPHNLYLYIFFTGGIIGMLFFIFIIIKSTCLYNMNSNLKVSIFSTGVIGLILLNGISESLTSTPLLFPIILILYNSPWYINEVKRKKLLNEIKKSI